MSILVSEQLKRGIAAKGQRLTEKKHKETFRYDKHSFILQYICNKLHLNKSNTMVDHDQFLSEFFMSYFIQNNQTEISQRNL